MDIKELESGIDPQVHWYYQTKKIPFEKFVLDVVKANRNPVNLVDVGSGSGFFMHEIDRDFPNAFKKAFLVDIEYSDKEIEETKGSRFEKLRELPDTIENSVVVLMDVLEHLESDLNMLTEIRKRCVGKNYFFITVPAFKSVWSGHDVYLGHYRRYTRKTLREVLKKAGYSIQSVHYLYGLIFPLVWIYRRFQKDRMNPKSDMSAVGAGTNKALKLINSLEMKIGSANTYFGLTCSATGEISQPKELR